MLLYFISLFYFGIVISTNKNTSLYLIHLFFCLILKYFILFLNKSHCLINLINFMVFVFFGMLINTLHAKKFFFLLTKEHHIFFVKVALGNHLFNSFAFIGWFFTPPSFRLVACPAAASCEIRSLPLGPDTGESLRVRHLFELSFCELRFFRVTRYSLSQWAFV